MPGLPILRQPHWSALTLQDRRLEGEPAVSAICQKIRGPATQPASRQGSPSSSLAALAPDRPRGKGRTALDIAPIADILPYIDTVGIFFPKRPAGLLAAVNAIKGPKAWFEESRSPTGFLWGVILILNQPSRERLRALDPWMRKYDGRLSRLDIAYDFFPTRMSTAEITQWFRMNAILRWRAKGGMRDVKQTTYYCEQTAPRNLTLYPDRPSKLGSEADPVLHVELRLRTAKAISAEGFALASDLISLDPKSLMDKHIRIVAFDHHIQRDVMGARDKNRVRAFYERFYRSRAQLLKDRRPDIIHRLRSYNPMLIMADGLQWGAKAHDREEPALNSLAKCLPKLPSPSLIMSRRPEIA